MPLMVLEGFPDHAYLWGSPERCSYCSNQWNSKICYRESVNPPIKTNVPAASPSGIDGTDMYWHRPNHPKSLVCWCLLSIQFEAIRRFVEGLWL
jgi:hypothetical protein